MVYYGINSLFSLPTSPTSPSPSPFTMYGSGWKIEGCLVSGRRLFLLGPPPTLPPRGRLCADNFIIESLSIVFKLESKRQLAVCRSFDSKQSPTKRQISLLKKFILSSNVSTSIIENLQNIQIMFLIVNTFIQTVKIHKWKALRLLHRATFMQI